MHKASKKLGFWGLTALIFGMMVGVGIFNLPQNMAKHSAVGPVAVSWLISAAGIMLLVYAFKVLSDRFPQYNAGIYQYAQAGFGAYTGFNIAWGYWLCTAFSNVTYAVMLNDALGAFFPSFMNHGWETVLFGSALIWVMYFIVSCGIRTAKIINTTLAAVKVVVLIFIIFIFCTEFDSKMLSTDIWGFGEGLGSIGNQIKDSMMITLFCFFGIEGAVMMSARAKKPSDVGKAGVAGFIISWLLYLLISILCFGLMSRARLGGLPDPSIAYILKDTCGEWTYYFVIGAVIISLLGGWVAWTLIVAQVPYEASVVKILPKAFKRLNKNGMPTFGLFASSIVMELFLLLVVTADDVYLAALHITGLMIIPCYLFTALFLWKIAWSKTSRIFAILATLFCLWMIYAGGLKPMLMTSLFYLVGVGFYIKARRENSRSDCCPRIFSKSNQWELYLLSGASIISIFLLLSDGSPF